MTASPLLGFIVGSSILVVAPFFWRVARMPQGFKNYSYADYTLAAPLYLGAMTALAVWLSRWWGLRAAIAGVSVLSPLIVVGLAYAMGSYNFSGAGQWLAYALRLTVKHMLVYNIVIYGLLVAVGN